MKAKRLIGCTVVCAAFIVSVAAAQSLSPVEQLGKALFFDQNLSTPPGQSCAACHAPGVGFTGPVSAINAGQPDHQIHFCSHPQSPEAAHADAPETIKEWSERQDLNRKQPGSGFRNYSVIRPSLFAILGVCPPGLANALVAVAKR
jgi:hypothetical protein